MPTSIEIGSTRASIDSGAEKSRKEQSPETDVVRRPLVNSSLAAGDSRRDFLEI